MAIQILSPEVVSRIAAGEVVERPASVVKELIENSLDAGASQITVEARGGGVSLIRVTDNGSGMAGEEVELAFHRYATSKISSLADLETIGSLGFRGEALPSIAAVSAVEVFTQTKGEAAGIFLSLREGVVLEKKKGGRSPGTSVTVRNLFYNVPARRKFLKSLSTEDSHIAQVVSMYALAFPGVKFTLLLEGRPAFGSPGSGSLRDAAAAVYGLETAQALLEVATKEGVLPQIGGLISPPHLARSSRAYLSFFLNRRWIRSPMLARAVEEGYHGLLMSDRHPIAILHLALPPQEVDVNVHPTKAEIRFRDGRAVFSAVHQAIRQALAEKAPIPSLEVAPSPHFEPAPQATWLMPSLESSPAYPATAMPLLRVLGQAGTTYIIAEGPDGLYLIDQHAAHERVLFEKLKAQWERQEVEVQGLLEPLVLELAPRQRQSLSEEKEVLTGYGFSLEPFGEASYILRSAPAVLAGRDLVGVVGEILDSLAQGDKAGWEEKIAISLACHGAVRAGQVLSHQEMQELVRQLEKSSQPRTCPHGRPTMVHLSAAHLDREFGRR